MNGVHQKRVPLADTHGIIQQGDIMRSLGPAGETTYKWSPCRRG